MSVSRKSLRNSAAIGLIKTVNDSLSMVSSAYCSLYSEEEKYRHDIGHYWLAIQRLVDRMTPLHGQSYSSLAGLVQGSPMFSLESLAFHDVVSAYNERLKSLTLKCQNLCMLYPDTNEIWTGYLEGNINENNFLRRLVEILLTAEPAKETKAA